MSLKRHNHYVPKMYLKRWHSNDPFKIFVYNLLASNENVPIWKEQAISRTASLDNLYLHIKDDAELDDIEQEFDSQFEANAQSVIDKACSNQRISASEWEVLVDYVAAQAVRTPAFYHQSKPFLEELVPKVLEDTLEKLVNLKEPPQGKTSPLEYGDLIPISIRHTPLVEDPEKALLEAGTVVGKNTWLFSIKHALSKNSQFREKLKSFHWSIADAPERIEWPTSDNPFLYVTKNKNGTYQLEHLLNGRAGLDQKDKILLFPISPKKILITKTCGRYPARFTLTLDEAILVRSLIIKNAFLYIYHYQIDNDIVEIRPRIIDVEKYKRLHNEYDNWYESYREDEAPLLKSNIPFAY